jgi:hypothetical protein
MLHKKRVARALYYSARRWLRIRFRLKPSSRPPPVLGQPIENVIHRHAWIARTFLDNLPPELDLTNKRFGEVGPGDCLAMAGVALGMGATRVDMIEMCEPVVNEKQVQVLRALKVQKLPMDLSMIREGDPPQLDNQRVVYHRCFMEQFNAREEFDFIFSNSVVEHVEDLAGFHQSCRSALVKGGWALHIIDLGGHSEFEDPVPPLDFQTYSDLLFACMYPKYHRATRRFLSEHQNAFVRAGLVLERVKILRSADHTYMQALRPALRRAARQISPEELAPVEVAILARKQ